MKKVFKYIIIFVVTITVLFFSLVATSLIPKSAIKKNMKESLKYYEKVQGIERIVFDKYDTYIHYYADTRKLNIIYNMDSKHPIKSTLWSKYTVLTHMDINLDLIETVTHDIKPNDSYLRYWNGCMMFLRPLLTILNMEQIYLVNKIILYLLAIVLLILLFRRSKKLSIIFLLSLILTSSWYITYCIEYSVMFYVMIITSILVLLIDNPKKDINKINNKLFILFFITGIVTTFFDFLTTELLTIFIPLLFLLIIRKEEKRLGTLKDTIIFSIKVCLLWFIGYGFTWLAKWILSSVVLNINAFDYVKDNLKLRFGGLQGLEDSSILYKNVIPRNLFSISFMYYIRENITNWKTIYFLVVFVLILLFFTNWKELKNKKFLLIILFIALMPYARFLVLANHSYRHPMFTFRAQIITLVCLMYIIVDCFNYKLLFKKIEIGTTKKKVKK